MSRHYAVTTFERAIALLIPYLEKVRWNHRVERKKSEASIIIAKGLWLHVDLDTGEITVHNGTDPMETFYNVEFAVEAIKKYLEFDPAFQSHRTTLAIQVLIGETKKLHSLISDELQFGPESKAAEAAKEHFEKLSGL